MMSQLQKKQIQFELDTWKRALYFMMDENVHCKTMLSEMLKYNQDKKFLVKAEQFQGQFIKLDEKIRILRNELADINLLDLKKKESDTPEINPVGIQEILRRNMVAAEIQARKLRLNFNCYLVKLHPGSHPQIHLATKLFTLIIFALKAY